MDDDPNAKPPKPDWLRAEFLMPVAGILVLGLIFGSFLVIKSIQKEHRTYRPAEYGPMDRRPTPAVVVTNQTNNASVETNREEKVQAPDSPD